MKRIIATLLTVCMVMVSNVFVFAAEPVTNYKSNDYKDFITYNAPLTNTYKRLTEDKALNIVYFGGSVTVGFGAKNSSGESANETHSWRALSVNWFKEKFPTASISARSSAMGGTGTFLGNIRLETDVLELNPDLVFIEFAINDNYCGNSKEQAALQFETIVREIRNRNPECDIITVLTTDQSKAAEYPFPELYPTASGHAEIANAYNLPIINVGQALVQIYLGGNPQSPMWSTYYIDTVHPSSAGYEEYYRCIEEYLNNALLNTDFSGCEKSAHKMPAVVSENLLDGDKHTYEGADMAPFVEEAVGFKLDAGTTWSSFPKHTGYYHVKDISNSSLTIKFIGTDLTLWTNLGRGSSMNYILDGGAEQTYDFTNNGPKPFLTGLESGEHTVVIKPTSLQSDADEFKLYAIFSRDASKQTVKGTAFEHIHFSLDGDWNKGDTEHYQICNCGEKFNLSEHVFTEWEISKEATADTQGTKKRECELCGKKETQKYSLNEQLNESQPTVESNSDVGGEPASFPVVPVAVGGGVLVVIIAVVVIILAKKKKK